MSQGLKNFALEINVTKYISTVPEFDSSKFDAACVAFGFVPPGSVDVLSKVKLVDDKTNTFHDGAEGTQGFEALLIPANRIGIAFYLELLNTEAEFIKDLEATEQSMEAALNGYQEVPGCVTKQEFIVIKNQVRALIDAQKRDFASLYEPNPQNWAAILKQKQEVFAQFIASTTAIRFPPNVSLFFQKFVSEQCHRQNLGIEAYSIKPLQRIGKYSLLMRDMAKNVSNAQMSAALGGAEAGFSEVTLALNAKQRLTEDNIGKALIQKAIDAFNQKPGSLEAFKFLISEIVISALSPEIKNEMLAKVHFDKINNKQLKSLQETIASLKDETTKITANIERKEGEIATDQQYINSQIAKGADPKTYQAEVEKVEETSKSVTNARINLGKINTLIEALTVKPNNDKKAQAGAATSAAGAKEAKPKQAQDITLSDVIITTKLLGTSAEFTETRKKAKELLRNTTISGWQVEEMEKKGFGKRAEFIVKDVNQNNVCKITIEKNIITVTQAEGANLEAVHKFLQQLRGGLPAIRLEDPKIATTNIDEMVALTQIGLNNAGITLYYGLGAKEAKLVKDKIKETQQKEEISKFKMIPAVSIELNEGKIPSGTPVLEEVARKQEIRIIKEKYQKELDKGLFVPQLAIKQGTKVISQANFEAGEQRPSPLLISTSLPLLAIKQFEAVLAAGFTPKLSENAKEAVQTYVNAQVKANLKAQLEDPTKVVNATEIPIIAGAVTTERQIKISGPLSTDGKIDGKEVLRRIKVAAENGFIVDVDPQAKQALRDYLQSSPTVAAEFNVNIPKGTEPVMLIRNLVELGIVPFNVHLEKEIKESVKNANKLPIVTVNSGSVQQDLKVMQQCLVLRGMRVNVQNAGAVKTHVKKELVMIDLRNVDPDKQIEEAQKLALMGINSRVSVPVPTDKPFAISSENAKHALAIFQTILNQGFNPQLLDEKANDSTKQLVQEHLKNVAEQIKIDGRDPKVLFERVQKCMEMGLIPALDGPQKEVLQQYARKNNVTLNISGFNGVAVRANIGLASEIGATINVKDEAKRAYFMEQRKNIAKVKGSAEQAKLVTVAQLHPQMTTKSRYLLGDITVVDLDKTIKQIQALQKLGICVEVVDLGSLRAKAEENAKKRGFFGLGGPTKEAKQNIKFLGDLNKCVEVEDKHNRNNIQVTIDQIDPPLSPFAQKSTEGAALAPAGGHHLVFKPDPTSSKAESESTVADAKAGGNNDDDEKTKKLRK